MNQGYHRLLSRPLMLKRTMKVVDLYTQLGDWSEVRRNVIEQNIFQNPVLSTVEKEYGEIKRRLITLPEEAISLFARSSADTAKYLNLIAIFNVYPIFRDFMGEFVYHRLQMGNRELLKYHFEQFVEEMKFNDEELRHKRDITVKKSANFIFQILRETALIEGETVVPPLLPYEITDLLNQFDPSIKRGLLQ